MTGILWGEVARRLVEALQPVMPDGWAMTELVPLLEGLQKEEGEWISNQSVSFSSIYFAYCCYGFAGIHTYVTRYM